MTQTQLSAQLEHRKVVLYLCLAPFSLRHFCEFLREAGLQAVILAKKGALDNFDLTSYSEVIHNEQFADYSFSEMVEWRAIELHRRFRFWRILHSTEGDIMRAARLRGLLGIEGQQIDSARAFRDKLVMKAMVAERGIDTPLFQRIDHIDDLIRFVECHGYPFVLKPRCNADANGVCLIHRERDLLSFLSCTASAADQRFLDRPMDYLAESYIEGEMFHVDAVYSAGELAAVAIGKYVGPLCGHQPRENEVVGDVIFRADAPEYGALLDFFVRVVEALPTPPTCGLHTEIWKTADERLLLNEIAARLGGGLILTAIEIATQHDFQKMLYQAQTERLPPAVANRQVFSSRYVAAGRAPQRAGVVAAFPSVCPLPWVSRFRPTVKLGKEYRRGLHTRKDSFAEFFVEGVTFTEAQTRLHDAVAWFNEHLAMP